MQRSEVAGPAFPGGWLVSCRRGTGKEKHCSTTRASGYQTGTGKEKGCSGLVDISTAYVERKEAGSLW